MLHRRFRIQVVVRLALAIGAALALAYVVGWTRIYELYLILGGVLAYLVLGLVRYVERTTSDLARFLEAVRYGDFSQSFAGGGRGPLFDRLAGAFEAVGEQFRRVRAEQEEQLRFLEGIVQHVGTALVAFGPDGRIELMNAAAKRLLETPGARTVHALSAFSDELARTLLRLGAGDQALVRVEREGRALQLSVFATQFRLRGALYTLASLQDIRHPLEEKEMEAWQQLTRVLTHEIMNSVAPIASLASTANRLLRRHEQDRPADEEPGLTDVREALEVIGRRSRALIGFVDAYRSFTRIPQPDFRTVPVAPLLDRVRRLLETHAQKQGATLRTRVEPPELTLVADPDLIEQVLINLLLNALQATEGRPDAQVELRAAADRHGLPVLQVADDGPGIPPEALERIFVPFFTTKQDGSGIGLSLSREIMRLHGGSISVRSKPGETVFTLHF